MTGAAAAQFMAACGLPITAGNILGRARDVRAQQQQGQPLSHAKINATGALGCWAGWVED